MWAGFQHRRDCVPSLTSVACQNYCDACLVKSRRAAWLYYQIPIQVSGTPNQKWRIQSMKGMTGAPPPTLYLDLSCCIYGVHMYLLTYFQSFLFAVEIEVAVCYSLTHIYPVKHNQNHTWSPLTFKPSDWVCDIHLPACGTARRKRSWTEGWAGRRRGKEGEQKVNIWSSLSAGVYLQSSETVCSKPFSPFQCVNLATR